MKNTQMSNLKGRFPFIKIIEIHIDNNESIHSYVLKNGIKYLKELIFNTSTVTSESNIEESKTNELVELYEGKLRYRTSMGTFYILGNLPTDLGIMKVSILFEELHTKKRYRNRFDLFCRKQLMDYVIELSEALEISSSELEVSLLKLTDLLDEFRELKFELNIESSLYHRSIPVITPQQQNIAQEFLEEDNLITRLNKEIGISGIQGEEVNRLLLFIIASTYKMNNPLHGLVQGTSGSGKSHLINSIANLMPQEDVMNMTRVTSKSLYYYKDDDLVNKLVLIQDFDGLDEEAQFAFREMQSAGYVSSSTTSKDRFGKLVSSVKKVNAHFSSLVATTHAEIYYDNMSRSISIGVDESKQQTLEIIDYQNKLRAGLIDINLQSKSVELLQNCIRILKPYEVVNHYADKIQLPIEAKMLRRLNNHYQSFVNQITILHQYQREVDNQGRLIATVDDLKIACEILFDSIMWKIDELDSTLRQFFEDLKMYVYQQKDINSFTVRDVRIAFNLSKSQVSRYLQELRQLEYIKVEGGSSNRGYRYIIDYWDDMNKIRSDVKEGLMKQIDAIK